MSRFHHYAHLAQTPITYVGQYVRRGDPIGVVGTTGNSTGNHCHFEVLYGKPPTWRSYVTRGLSLQSVAKMYQDPSVWLSDALPFARSGVGYKFLQSANGIFHPGIDLTAKQGTVVRSLCNGRVQFQEGVPLWARIAPRMSKNLNGGWGGHVWIEVDESKPGI